MRKGGEVWFVACLILLVLWGAYRAASRPPTLPSTVKRDSLVVALSSAKTVLTTAQYATKEASLVERQLASRVATRVGLLRDSLTVVRETLLAEQDSAHQLQAALLMATQEAESLAVITTQYLEAVDTLRAKYAEERRAASVALARADSVIAQQDTLITALTQRECRVFGKACPSRGTVAGAAMLLTLLLTR
jgi:hypothetical protein